MSKVSSTAFVVVALAHVDVLAAARAAVAAQREDQQDGAEGRGRIDNDYVDAAEAPRDISFMDRSAVARAESADLHVPNASMSGEPWRCTT